MKTQFIRDAVVTYSMQTALDTPRGQSFSAHVKSNLNAMAIYNLIIDNYEDVFGSSIFENERIKGCGIIDFTERLCFLIAVDALEHMEMQSINGARKALTMMRAKKILCKKVGDLIAFHAKKVFTPIQ